VTSTRVDDLVRHLVLLTGEDEETALVRAIEERLARVAATASEVDRRAALQKFVERVSAMPVKDARSADEIIGYGADGLPS
jgi:antitoxin VapB